MTRTNLFTFKVNQEERRMLQALAAELERSQSDTIRLLIRGAVKELGVSESDPQPAVRKSEHAESG